MDSPTTVTRIKEIQQFEALRNEWSHILSQSESKDAFLTWEWMFSWWKNIGQHNHQLWLLTVRDGERLIGIAPLMLNTRKKSFFRYRKLENIGNPDCDVSGIVSLEPEKTARVILTYLLDRGSEWDILEIRELPQDCQGTQLLLAAIRENNLRLVETNEKHFYIPLTGTWEQYYNRLSKNLKHNLKRRRRRAEEMGAIKVERYSGQNLRWEHFLRIFKLNEKSNFPDLYQSEQNQSFHKDLFNLMQAHDWIQIEILFINEKPVAFQYGFTYDGKYEDWRGGIDKEYEFIAPGKLLMMLTMEKRFESEFEESDFLRGNHAYKTDWNPLKRDFLGIQVFNKKSLKARLAFAWIEYIKPHLNKRPPITHNETAE